MSRGALDSVHTMGNPTNPFGRNLARIRDARGLTQEQLARRIGVHTMTVTKWEGGTRRRLSAEHLVALSNALKVPIYLLRGERRPEVEEAIERYKASSYWQVREEEGNPPGDPEVDFLRFAIDGLWIKGDPTPKALDLLISLARAAPELINPPE